MVELLLELAHLVHERVGVVGRHLLGDLVEPVELALDLGDTLLDVLQDGLVLGQRRLLEQDADGVAGGEEGVTVGRLLQTGHDLQDRRLAGAVRADDADLRSRVEARRHVVEDHLVAVRFARLAHGVNELSQEKPSGSLKLAVGRYTPSCRTARPGRKRVSPGDSDLAFLGCRLPGDCHCRSPLVDLGHPRTAQGRPRSDHLGQPASRWAALAT